MTAPTRLLGVDYGTRRVGLAISDADRRIASPFALYERRTPEQDADYIRQIVDAEDISAIVVGLPVRGSGHEGEKAQEARAFGGWLHTTTRLPIIYWDERYTTADAEQFMREAGLTDKQRKARRDMVAAQIMLQSYLDAGCPPTPDIGPLADD